MAYFPKVSIVIPAYNASNYLAEAIESALSQTYKNIEIIVVNDGSKDDGATEDVCKQYEGKIRYFHKENGGSSSAINVGIKNMTGEWFSWLSHDDLYYPEKIEKEIQYLSSLGLSEEAVKNCVCFSASEIVDAKGNLIRTTQKKQIEETKRYIDSLKGNQYLIAEPTRFTFHGCSCLVHKSVFDNIGGFDEKLRLLNDMDMWYRIYAAGYRICYVPEVLVKGRVHGKQVSRSIGYSYHNPEQDMYWGRALEWLIENYPKEYELFCNFGKNAFQKTRTEDGKKAFEVALSINPNKKTELMMTELVLKNKASVYSFLKKIYYQIKK